MKLSQLSLTCGVHFNRCVTVPMSRQAATRHAVMPNGIGLVVCLEHSQSSFPVSEDALRSRGQPRRVSSVPISENAGVGAIYVQSMLTDCLSSPTDTPTLNVGAQETSQSQCALYLYSSFVIYSVHLLPPPLPLAPASLQIRRTCPLTFASHPTVSVFVPVIPEYLIIVIPYFLLPLVPHFVLRPCRFVAKC